MARGAAGWNAVRAGNATDRSGLAACGWLDASVTSSYNGDGQVASVDDAAGTTTYAYDDAGRVSALADPLTGTTLSYSYT